MYGIRIDLGNLEELSKKCRKVLNEKGFYRSKIILTGGLDEKKIKELIENGAEVDIFGVGDAIALVVKELMASWFARKAGVVVPCCAPAVPRAASAWPSDSSRRSLLISPGPDPFWLGVEGLS